MLYELWCKRFGISLLLFKRIDQLLMYNMISKNDFCILDLELLQKKNGAYLDVIKDLTLKSHCLLASDFKNAEADKLNLQYKTKTKSLELLESLYFSRSSSTKDATFL